MFQTMKIGFFGAGNMATAIIKGAASANAVTGENIYIYDTDIDKMKAKGSEFSINCCLSPEELISSCDAVIMAVKPNILPVVLSENSEFFKTHSPLIISIAAGRSIQYISDHLGYDARIVRVMPNINAVVQSAMCAYCCNKNVSPEDVSLVEALFSSIGRTISLDESYFPIFGVIAGSAPAFAYMFIDSLARGGVKNGLSKQAALEIAAQTVLGSAQMILNGSSHPYELADMVCSPGGTTIEGVCSLQKNAFESSVIEAVDATLAKDKFISQS